MKTYGEFANTHLRKFSMRSFISDVKQVRGGGGGCNFCDATYEGLCKAVILA